MRRSSAAGRADPAQRADFEGHAAKVGPQGLDHRDGLGTGAGSHGATPAGTAITIRPWARFQIRANSAPSAASSSFAAPAGAGAGAGVGVGVGVGAGFFLRVLTCYYLILPDAARAVWEGLWILAAKLL